MLLGPKGIASLSPWDPNKIYSAITAINYGRRPVKISKAGYKLYGKREKPWVIAGDSKKDDTFVFYLKPFTFILTILYLKIAIFTYSEIDLKDNLFIW